MNILLVEDDEAIAKALKYVFIREGYEFINAKTKKQAIEILQHSVFDIIILDVSLPDGNGFDLYEDSIHDLNISTLFLTAKEEEDAIVKGLEMGAEDYITKPFSTRELLARVHKILLRNKKNNIIKVKDISFDIDKMVVYKENTQISLTNLELQILYLLFTRVNKVVTRNTIIEKIWDLTGNDVEDNTVTVYLKRIRKKLGTDIIVTLKGIGYRIDQDDEK